MITDLWARSQEFVQFWDAPPTRVATRTGCACRAEDGVFLELA